MNSHAFILYVLAIWSFWDIACMDARQAEGRHDLRHGYSGKESMPRAHKGQRTPFPLSAGTVQDFRLFVCPQFSTGAEETELFEHPEQWSTVGSLIAQRNGAFHFHDRELFDMLDSDQAKTVIKFFSEHPTIPVSLESGGYLCNGTQLAMRQLGKVENFTAIGGRIDVWALESIFSRTLSGCSHEITTVEQVAEQAADYAAILKKALPNLQFGVIDAVPHFSAGKYPANSPKVDYGDIRIALAALKKTLAARGIELLFYWADCPYDYSVQLPGNTGYEKLAVIANYTTNELGIRMGKIFNSELGGQTSDLMYYTRSLEDYHRYMATVPMNMTSDIVAEGWYPYPKEVIPETQPYTFMYTARNILELASNRTKAHGQFHAQKCSHRKIDNNREISGRE